jgi:nitrogenase molybdenum-iron protein alpha/beta subunit
MTGAAACLAGFDGITVVIHGSSGCYYYPTTLLHAQLHGTFILENEVIFGSEDRLREVISGLSGTGKRIAVITTCVPAILGEDIQSMLADLDVILVDSPGFSGNVESGYANALARLGPQIDPDMPGVNIEGACLFDPFSCGNVQEIRRMFARASVPAGTIFCQDRLENVCRAAPLTIGTNGDFPSGVGQSLGGTLGLDAISASFHEIGNRVEEADVEPVLLEIRQQEERIVRACDKYLQRFDPPSTVIFAGFSYARFAAEVLDCYLDAEICCIGSRNVPGESRFPVTRADGISQVYELITAHNPDLVIGSSFERAISRNTAFVGLIPPLRGTVRLAPAPLAGINGTLSFIEHVLNACMDTRPLIG